MYYSKLYSAFTFLSMILLSACQQSTSNPAEAEMTSETEVEEIIINEQQFKQAQMELGTIQEIPLNKYIQTTGTIEIPASNQIKISAYAGGYVGKLDLHHGQYVRKGERLFTLENPAFITMQQEYLQTKAELIYLSADYERQQKLAEENITAEKQFGKVESEYKAHIALAEGLKKQLELLGINPTKVTTENLVSSIAVYAPSNAYVTEVHARQGMFLNPTDVALELVNTDHLHLELFIYEKDIFKIKKGQKVKFRLPEANMESYDAEIYLIGKNLDEERRVVQVHAHFSEAVEKSISIAGLYVEAEIILGAEIVRGLPEAAILYEEEQAIVLVQKEASAGRYVFEKRQVELGASQDGMVEILNVESLAATDKILTKGAFNLVGIE